MRVVELNCIYIYIYNSPPKVAPIQPAPVVEMSEDRLGVLKVMLYIP